MPDTPAQLPPRPLAASPEDAGTQAFSEALGSSFKVIKFLMAGLGVVFVFSGMFTVQPNEEAIILRFGKPVGTGSEQLLKPGWHWSFPYPIDEVVRIPIGQSHTVRATVGWFATTAELEALGKEPPPRPTLTPGLDGYTLTGDGNIIHVRTTLKYRIRPADALAYTLKFASLTNVLQDVVNNALFHAAARYTADAALYRDPTGFKELVLNRVNQKIEELELAIALEPSEVQTSAPLAVRPAFDAVLAAAQDRSKKISEARGQAEEITRKAAGEAEAIRNAGLTASNRIVSTVAADARFFTDQLPHFRQDPVLFQRRLLSETMERVLTNAQAKFFVPARADGKPRELRLQLSREPEKPARPAANP
jgi:membrane protease subunit HflK